MSERALLERFDLVADYPENIPLLRRYIVDLAIRGKLLEKTDLDISASEMLKRIGAKADSLLKEGKLKKQKPLALISSDEIPVTYAAHCTFERLGNIANLQKGLTGIQSSIPGEFPLVVTAAARSTCDHYDFDGAAAIVPMVSSTGHGNASLNRLHYQEGKFALGTILCAVFPIDEELISARFLFEYLTAFKDELLVSQMNGTANVTLTAGKIAAVPVPIIAPAVQKRVDELMALCDQLEVAKNEREARRDRLVAASLHRIGTAPAVTDEAATVTQSATPLRDAARFHLDHLLCLTTRPEHIKQLRQTILNLAVRGRLVPQDPNDEPAAEVLKCVVAERDALIKAGRIRKEKPLSPIANESVPFEVPRSWVWAKIGEAALFTEYGTSQQSNHSDSGVPVLKMGDIQDGRLLLGGQNKVPVTIDDLPALYLENRDLLYNRTNSAELVGKTGIYIGSDNEYTFASYLIRIRCSQLSTSPEYFNMAMNAPWFRETQIVPQLKQQCGQANVNGTIMKNMLIPIPPLAEQHRIVAKVDELMALCDQLEAQLTAAQTDSRRLLEAVLHEALAA